MLTDCPRTDKFGPPAVDGKRAAPWERPFASLGRLHPTERLRRPGDQFAQDIRQDPAVEVVVDFDRRIDAQGELNRLG